MARCISSMHSFIFHKGAWISAATLQLAHQITTMLIGPCAVTHVLHTQLLLNFTKDTLQQP